MYSSFIFAFFLFFFLFLFPFIPASLGWNSFYLLKMKSLWRLIKKKEEELWLRLIYSSTNR